MGLQNLRETDIYFGFSLFMSQSYSKYGNFFIKQGRIEDSSIDMNYRKITSVADPVYPYDAVNFKTLQATVSPTPGIYQQIITITLSGETPVPLTNFGKTGFYNIIVSFQADQVNGPYLKIETNRINQWDISYIKRKGARQIQNLSTFLFFSWPINDYMYITKKNDPSNAWDGTYRVVIYNTQI